MTRLNFRLVLQTTEIYAQFGNDNLAFCLIKNINILFVFFLRTNARKQFDYTTIIDLFSNNNYYSETVAISLFR